MHERYRTRIACSSWVEHSTKQALISSPIPVRSVSLVDRLLEQVGGEVGASLSAHYWVLKAQTVPERTPVNAPAPLCVEGDRLGVLGGVLCLRPAPIARVGGGGGIDRTLRTTQWTRASMPVSKIPGGTSSARESGGGVPGGVWCVVYLLNISLVAHLLMGPLVWGAWVGVCSIKMLM